ncbi:truncated XRN1 [Cannes 8 virus]|uniref:Truncated XRN1 n=1 Tax=Marseillevirus marseillevirus TaxID=694581 RepID=D2XAW6_GBMV|nr:truncated XRN1 [Marseillevirus marseillevirus]ADB04093.1 truncated XRN1 [Marseillevirus marseillevirus]AGV01688.1 truncated XRN1 [Cannes 8 virus]
MLFEGKYLERKYIFCLEKYTKRQGFLSSSFAFCLLTVPPLTEEVEQILRGVQRELVEVYPKKIEVDYEGKFRPYESVPLLPHVDVSKIQTKLEKIR